MVFPMGWLSRAISRDRGPDERKRNASGHLPSLHGAASTLIYSVDDVLERGAPDEVLWDPMLLCSDSASEKSSGQTIRGGSSTGRLCFHSQSWSTCWRQGECGRRHRITAKGPHLNT